MGGVSELQTGSETIAVVGAGIAGVATAINLQRRGKDVVLIDRGTPGDGASTGNAGILSSASIMPVSVPGLVKKIPGMLADPLGPVYMKWLDLPRLAPWLMTYMKNGNVAHVRHVAASMAPLIADSLDEHLGLAEGTGAAARIREMPYGFVFANRAAFESDTLGWGLRKEHGISWEVLEGGAVRDAEPDLAAKYECLVRMTHQHGIVDLPGDYVKELARVFVDGGGILVRASVSGFVREDNRITGLKTDTGEIAASTVVVAAGAWSARLLKTLGLRLPMESERGYHVELLDASVRPHHALMIAEGKFVVTPMDGRLRLAGLAEYGGLDAAPSAAPVRTLLKRAELVFPEITYERSTDWMGHRPALADSLPVIGPVNGHPGLILAFGHHHVGLTAGPRTGRLVADMICGLKPNMDLTPFDAGRF